MAPIGVAILGGGIWVKEQHLPAVLECDDLELKAIYSRSLKSAQDSASLIKKAGVSPELYAEDAGAGKALADVLGRSDVSAVVIALTITTQPQYIEAALSAGKHVLAEKPIAPDVAGARKLIDFYKKAGAAKSVTFAIAENFRFIPKFLYAKDEVAKLGKVTGFAIKVFSLQAEEGNKWMNTAWRKKPEHQGGFVLDGGVHTSAAFRLLLGKDMPETVMALTTQTQEHLPPLDTVHALVKTKSGAIGTFSISQGTTLSASEYAIACESGSVTVADQKVIVTRGTGNDKQEHTEEFEWTTGVKELVKAWAASLATGKPDPLQSPDLAMGDLELLEMMFKSGTVKGEAQKLQLQ